MIPTAPKKTPMEGLLTGGRVLTENRGMSYLLFLDESGHDHSNTPYEVRGGFAVHVGKIWSLVRDLERLENETFGVDLATYGGEIKGAKILEKRRFEWAAQMDELDNGTRKKHVLSFFEKGRSKQPPSRIEFTAYGQACLKTAHGVFEILVEHDAKVFAVAIPREVEKPDSKEAESFFRKDQVFLLERYFFYLERMNEYGLLVMDETDDALDRTFVRRMERYYRGTATGRYRATRVVPSPFFVSSEMSLLIQAADLCIYCINWGYRRCPGMVAPVRGEIAAQFGPWLDRLKYHGDGYKEGMGTFKVFGIEFVPDPYTARK